MLGRIGLLGLVVACIAMTTSAQTWVAQPDVTTPSPSNQDLNIVNVTYSEQDPNFTDYGNFYPGPATVMSLAQVGDYEVYNHYNYVKAQLRLWSYTSATEHHWEWDTNWMSNNRQYVNPTYSDSRSAAGTWKKSFKKIGACGPPTDDTFTLVGQVELQWWLDGDASNGMTSKAMSQTNSQAYANVNKYPNGGSDTFEGSWNMDHRESGGWTTALNISWPPGFTIQYTSSDDAWTVPLRGQVKPIDSNWSSGTQLEVSCTISLFARAQGYLDSSAFHSYSLGIAKVNDFQLRPGS